MRVLDSRSSAEGTHSCLATFSAGFAAKSYPLDLLQRVQVAIVAIIAIDACQPCEIVLEWRRSC